MARISKEPVPTFARSKSLVPREIIFVKAASFTFKFDSIQQLRECLQYYERKIHPSSRISAKVFAAREGVDRKAVLRWEFERWFERLPMYLLEEPKRQKVIKALSKALQLAEAKKL